MRSRDPGLESPLHDEVRALIAPDLVREYRLDDLSVLVVGKVEVLILQYHWRVWHHRHELRCGQLLMPSHRQRHQRRPVAATRLAGRPGAATDLVAALDRAGVARAAVSAGGVVDLRQLSAQIVDGTYVRADADNDAVLDACQRFGDRLEPFYFANPHRDATAYRRRADQFRGLELSPAVHGVPLQDRRNRELVDVAAEHGHPVYLVCLGRPGHRAEDLVTLASHYPEVTFIYGHCGFFGIDVHGVEQIAAVPNIVAETSGCFAVVVKVALARLGPGRVLFGSEYPLQAPEVELAKLRSLGLDRDTWQQMTWHNALRLLGKDKETT